MASHTFQASTAQILNPSPKRHKMMPVSDALVSDPSHTAIATPKQSTMSENSSVGVGRLFSMKTDPTAATTGIEALQMCGRGVGHAGDSVVD